MRSLLLLCLFGLAFAPISLYGEEVKGPVEIYGVVYESVDPGPPFQEAPRQLEEWKAPPPKEKEKVAGFIPFSRPEPFDIKPWSRPKLGERIERLNCQLAQGEITSLWFALYALEPLSSLSITCQPLSKGKVPSVEVLYAHFWAQRTDWRGRTYYITPELLLPMGKGYALFPSKGGTLLRRPLHIPQGESRLFWLTIRSAETAQPGEYQFVLKIQAKAKREFTLPLVVRVLPFRLQKPEEKRWLLYPDVWWWGSAPQEKVSRILQDIKEHGIDGFTELPFGKIDLSRLKEGIVGYDPFPLLKFNEFMKKVGIKGPHTIGAWVEGECAQALGLQVDLNKEWPEELKEGVRKVAKCVVDTLKPYKIDWLFYGWDEPGPDNLAALQQYRCWYEGGAKTYVTFFTRETYEVAGQWMTAPCFSVGLINSPETAKWARRECDRRKQKFFWYGSGCYLGQEGRMFPNRYLTGWLFWKTKADAQVSWTLVRPHEDPFNDFDGIKANNYEPKDQCIVYPWFLRPNESDSIVDILHTIQWEAIREGINDYRYAYTLKKTVEELRKVADRKELEELAREGEETLLMVEESIPWGNEVGARGYSNKELQEVRGILAKEIERLVLALQGKKVSPRGKVRREVTLNIHILPPEMADISREVPLPVLSIPKMASPPRIDGEISEVEWRGAGIADIFYETQIGKPMPPHLATKAFLGYDDNALYIGFLCREPETGRIKAENWQRDRDGVWQDEGVEVFLAPADDPARYAHFIVNAMGSIYDELVFDTSWNPDIDVATRIEVGRWNCELAIPWSVLPFGKTPHLRLNLCRNHNIIGESVNYWAWSPTFGWFHNPSRFGIGKLTTAEIFITSILPPMLFGESSAKVGLYNRGEEGKEVLINGVKINLSPNEQKVVMIKVPGEVGMHTHKLRLSWEGGEEEWQFSYAIPKPLKIFSPLILVNEQGLANLAIALSVSEEIKNKGGLILETAGKRYLLPLKEDRQTLPLYFPSPTEEIHLYIREAPQFPLKARLFIPTSPHHTSPRPTSLSPPLKREGRGNMLLLLFSFCPLLNPKAPPLSASATS